MTRSITWGMLAWGGGWLALATTVCLLLAGLRTRAIERLDRPEVRADWQRWKREAQRQSTPGRGPVQRRPPSSDEPPALILLRDHFAVVLAGSLVLLSGLYLFLVFIARGLWRTRGRSPGGTKFSPASFDD